MRRYYVTFGQQYRREQHPMSVNGVSPHPDGWVTIEANSYEAARAVAHRAFGVHWAFLYGLEPDRALYPLGELTVIW